MNIIKEKEFTGPLPHVIEETADVVRGQLREFQAMGPDKRFYVTKEYPEIAWYEAIVNACAHRSYNLRSMKIFVRMFDDRLIISSPGGFPPLVTPENIYRTQSSRNPFLMRALKDLGLVKCINEGTKRMRDALIGLRLPAPEFSEVEDTGGSVIVTMRNVQEHRRRYVDSELVSKGIIDEAIFSSLTPDERRLMNYMAEYNTLNVTQASRVLDRDWGATRARLDALVSRGLLRRKARTDILRDPKAIYELAT